MEALSSPPKVAADQNPFPLLPPSSRMSREKDLPMLNLGRAPSLRPASPDVTSIDTL
jgi:hypothetical protein